MSKDTTVNKENKTNNVPKEEINVGEVKENLRVQLKNHLDEADRHKTMAIKAQGALEVLLQLHPEEENK
tara:strand:- start:852 stop:1058 length:207 start_codon:yes stop_codon:yes gene_type:complete